MRFAWLVCLLGCADLRTQTRAFAPNVPCGQGPFDVHLVADGRTGEEGVEIVACTAHRIAGHVEVIANQVPLVTQAFGDTPDNGRCVAAGATAIVAHHAADSDTAQTTAPGGTPSAPAATLVEQPYSGGEPIDDDKLCAPYGLTAQLVLMPTTTTTELLAPGTDLHVRIWSDVPNDLEHAVFMIRHVTSTHTLAEVKAEDAKYAKEHAHDPPASPPRPRAVEHGPPPSPLAEARPQPPTPRATWIAGYWTWTGSSWGWVAGFWRDEQLAMPDPRIEVPGDAPRPAALWIGGTWQLRAGGWIWIHGRWR